MQLRSIRPHLRAAVAAALLPTLALAALAATPRAEAAANDNLAAPSGLHATVAGTSSLYVSWANRGPGIAYRVRYATSSAMDNADTRLFDAAGGVLTGLDSGKTYYLQVRAVSANGDNELSSYSDTVTAPATKKADPAVTVVTYNVRCWDCKPVKPWKDRRKAVANNILDQAPDVVSLQEASRGKMNAGQNGSSNERVPQFTDLLDLLGSPYAAVDTVSKGTRIVYNDRTLNLRDSGAVVLEGGAQYAVWAIFAESDSGTRFFYVDTHLKNGRSLAGYNTRVAQAKKIVSLIKDNNTADLPVLVTGDFNSHKGHKPSNGPYDVFMDAGLHDPVGNSDNSLKTVGKEATAEHMVNNQYNSFNNFKAAPASSKKANGYHVDYILHSKDVRVALWEMVLDLDTDGKFRNAPPSDHNLVKAIVHLG